jgi:hypothetical protein
MLVEWERVRTDAMNDFQEFADFLDKWGAEIDAQRTLSRRAETTGSAGTESGRVGNSDAPKG